MLKFIIYSLFWQFKPIICCNYDKVFIGYFYPENKKKDRIFIKNITSTHSSSTRLRVWPAVLPGICLTSCQGWLGTIVLSGKNLQ